MNRDNLITKFNVFKWVCDRYVECIRYIKMFEMHVNPTEVQTLKENYEIDEKV